MLKNAYSLSNIGANTPENEQTFADKLTKFRDVTDALGEAAAAAAPRGPPRGTWPWRKGQADRRSVFKELTNLALIHPILQNISERLQGRTLVNCILSAECNSLM